MVLLAKTGQFVKPEAVVTHFHLRDGDRVADFGAGIGNFSKILSRAVGNSGKVYACEIQRNLVEKLGHLKHEAKLSNLEPLWVDLERQGMLKIPERTLDCGVLANTLFQIEQKASALSEIARVLKPGGKFFIIDWSESFGGLGPAPGAVLTKEVAQQLAEEAGFSFERTFVAGAHHYGLAFRRT